MMAEEEGEAAEQRRRDGDGCTMVPWCEWIGVNGLIQPWPGVC